MGLFALLARFLPRRERKPQFAYVPLAPRRLERRRVLDAAGAGLVLEAFPDAQLFVQTTPLNAVDDSAEQQELPASLQGGPQATIRLRETELFEDQSTLAVVSIDDDFPMAHQVTIDWGDGSAATVINAGANQRDVLAVHRFLDDPAGLGDGSFTVTATITNTRGETTTTSAAILVKNIAPKINSLSLTSSINENGTATLTGTYSDVGTLDTHTLDIDWNGDGTFDQSVAVAGGTFSVSHQFLDDNPTGTPSDTFNVNVRLSDDDGGQATGFAPLTVRNIAPAIRTLQITSPVIENGTATLSGTYTDVGSQDTHELDIDWNGDGTFDQTVAISGGSFTVSRQFLDDNPTGTSDSFNVNVRLRDDDGGATVAAVVLTVQNANPVVVLDPEPISIFENGTAVLSGTYSDAGTLDTHELDIDWDGDGTFEQTVAVTGGAFTVTRQFLDDDPTGTRFDKSTVNVRLRDDDGGVGAASKALEVINVDPTVTLVPPSAIVENGVTTLSGTITDVGTLDTFTLLVSWGDTASPNNLQTFNLGTTALTKAADGIDWDPATRQFSVDHQYLDDNPTGTSGDTYDITVGVIDDDTGAAVARTTVTVQNAAPLLANVAITSPVVENGVAALTGTYSDAGSQDTHELDIDWDGDGTFDETVSVTGGSFSVNHQFLDDDPTGTANDISTVNLRLRDDDGGIDTASVELTVENAPPNVVLNPIAAIDENGTAVLTGTYSDVGSQDTHELDIDWNGDGTFDQTVVVSGGIFTVTRQFLDDDPSGTSSDTYNVGVRLRDDDGGSDFDSKPLTVRNVSPILTVMPPSAIDENGVATLAGTVSDVGTIDTFTLVVNWGDPASPNNTETYELGTTELTKAADGIDWDPATQEFSIDHLYLDDNPSGSPVNVYTIAIAVVDDDGGVDLETTPVTVRNLAPTLQLANGQTVDEGATLDLTGGALGSFVDAGTLDTHTATINWGDGTGDQAVSVIETSGSGDLSASHIYADNGVYTVRVTVVDDDGGRVTDTFRVTVVNVDPTLTGVDAPLAVDEGQLVTLASLGVGLQDPGFDNSHNPLTPGGSLETLSAISVDWGDGTGTQNLSIGTETDGGPNVPTTATLTTAEHAYADDGTYTVKVKVRDDDGIDVTREFTIIVSNVDPTLSIGISRVEINEGESIDLTGVFSDVGFDNDANLNGPSQEYLGYEIDWGDKSADDVRAMLPDSPGRQGVPTTGSFVVSHTYADNDDDNYYTISVKLFDDDGGSITKELQIRVLNVNPTLYPLTATDVTTRGIATVTVDFGDPGADTFVVHIDWGDDKPDAIAFDRAKVSLPHTFVHQYDGPPDPLNPSADITIRVFVTDDDFGIAGVVDTGLSNTETIEISNPGIGAEEYRIDTTPRVPQLTFPARVEPVFVVNAAGVNFTVQQTFDLGGSSGESRATADRYVELRVIDAEGNVGPGYRLRPEVLQDLPGLFRSLPDNHYALYLVNTETNTRRLVIEVYVRNGKLIDPGDDSEGTRDRPPTDEQTTEPQETVPTEAAPVELTPAGEQGAAILPAGGGQRFSRWTTLALGLAASASAQSWAHRVDVALAKATAEQWRKLQGHNRPKPKKQ